MPGTPHSIKDKYGHSAFFNSWQNILLSFFLLFLQLMKEKHPEGQEKEGLSAGSQPAPPSEASRARACLG